jgi:hypothetical protein
MEDDDNTQPTMQSSPFDAIRKVDEQGREYWNAKDLAKLLGYSGYSKFKNVIRKAEKSCEESGEAVSDHFAHVDEVIVGGKEAMRTFPTVHLSRYACYLVIENSDPHGRPIVALGQTYFAIQTRRQELANEQTLSALPEDQKRLIYRREMAALNHQLAEVAKLCGVIKPAQKSKPRVFEGRSRNQVVYGKRRNGSRGCCRFFAYRHFFETNEAIDGEKCSERGSLRSEKTVLRAGALKESKLSLSYMARRTFSCAIRLPQTPQGGDG